MKGVFASIIIFIFSFSLAGAYYDDNDFTQNKNKYKVILQKKIGAKLKKFPIKVQERIIDMLNDRITKIEDSKNMTDKQKKKTLAMYHALKEIIKDLLLSRPVVNITGDTI